MLIFIRPKYGIQYSHNHQNYIGPNIKGGTRFKHLGCGVNRFGIFVMRIRRQAYAHNNDNGDNEGVQHLIQKRQLHRRGLQKYRNHNG